MQLNLRTFLLLGILILIAVPASAQDASTSANADRAARATLRGLAEAQSIIAIWPDLVAENQRLREEIASLKAQQHKAPAKP